VRRSRTSRDVTVGAHALCVKLASDRAHPPHQELTNGNSQEVVPQEVRSQIHEAVVEREEVTFDPEKARRECSKVVGEEDAPHPHLGSTKEDAPHRPLRGEEDAPYRSFRGEEDAPRYAEIDGQEEEHEEGREPQIDVPEALELPEEAVTRRAREARRDVGGTAGGRRSEEAG